jgi:thiamine-phosphate pyrophosphorylase
MKIPHAFGLYAILTDPVLGYEFMTRLLVDFEVPFIQLRMKNTPPEVILATAEKLRAITSGTRSRFIINDNPEIAAKVNADGVHLGQEDLSFFAARAIVGPDAVIGLSTHSPAQTVAACALRPDYIGIGPVFPTPTKINADPVIGIDGMVKMIASASVPHVAIGGIDLSNLREVLEAGARNVCMVRQFMRASDPQKVLREVMEIYRDFSRKPGNAVSEDPNSSVT